MHPKPRRRAGIHLDPVGSAMKLAQGSLRGSPGVETAAGCVCGRRESDDDDMDCRKSRSSEKVSGGACARQWPIRYREKDASRGEDCAGVIGLATTLQR